MRKRSLVIGVVIVAWGGVAYLLHSPPPLLRPAVEFLASQRAFQFFLWLLGGTSTTLSLLGISLKELVLGPASEPVLVPNLYARRDGDKIVLEFEVQNVGAAEADDVVLEISATPPFGPWIVPGKYQATPGTLPRGGMHTKEWNFKPFPLASVPAGASLRLVATCRDIHGRRHAGVPRDFDVLDQVTGGPR